jgi:hypothetical protein
VVRWFGATKSILYFLLILVVIGMIYDTGCTRNIWQFLKYNYNYHLSHMLHFHTNIPHVKCSMEFNWDGVLVCAAQHCGCENVYQNRANYNYTASLPTTVPTCDAFSCNTLLLWVSKWHQKGSVKDSKSQGCQRLVHTPDNLEQVRATMLQSPHRSA